MSTKKSLKMVEYLVASDGLASRANLRQLNKKILCILVKILLFVSSCGRLVTYINASTQLRFAGLENHPRSSVIRVANRPEFFRTVPNSDAVSRIPNGTVRDRLMSRIFTEQKSNVKDDPYFQFFAFGLCL